MNLLTLSLFVACIATVLGYKELLKIVAVGLGTAVGLWAVVWALRKVGVVRDA